MEAGGQRGRDVLGEETCAGESGTCEAGPPRCADVPLQDTVGATSTGFSVFPLFMSSNAWFASRSG